MAPIRKYPSGAKKKKDKQRKEALVKLQAGSLNKYFRIKQAETSSNVLLPLEIEDEAEEEPENENGIEEQGNENDIEEQRNENEEHDQFMNENQNENEEVSQAMNDNESEEQSQPVNEEHDKIITEDNQDTNEDFVFSFNIDDPGNWDKIKRNAREFLVERGPRRDTNISFPKDDLGRSFNSSHYIRVLQNGEKQDRRWLVYSVSLDKVYCFCCKLFKQDHNKI